MMEHDIQNIQKVAAWVQEGVEQHGYECSSSSNVRDVHLSIWDLWQSLRSVSFLSVR